MTILGSSRVAIISHKGNFSALLRLPVRTTLLVLSLLSPLLTQAVAGDLLVSSATDVLWYDGETGASLGVFVSSGSGGLSGPRGLVFGPDGNLYVASRDSNQVLRYNGTTGAFIDAFTAGGGLDQPQAVLFRP